MLFCFKFARHQTWLWSILSFFILCLSCLYALQPLALETAELRARMLGITSTHPPVLLALFPMTLKTCTAYNIIYFVVYLLTYFTTEIEFGSTYVWHHILWQVVMLVASVGINYLMGMTKR